MDIYHGHRTATFVATGTTRYGTATVTVMAAATAKGHGHGHGQGHGHCPRNPGNPRNLRN